MKMYPMKPKNVPNPLGVAVFKGLVNLSRKGGELSVDRHPLVSQPPCPIPQKATVFSTHSWGDMIKLLNLKEDKRNYSEREEELREKSEEIQRGWNDLKKNKIEQIRKKIHDKETKREAEIRSINQFITQERLEESQKLVEKALDVLKHEDNRYSDIKRASLMMELLAEQEHQVKISEHKKKLLIEAEQLKEKLCLEHQSKLHYFAQKVEQEKAEIIHDCKLTQKAQILEKEQSQRKKISQCREKNQGWDDSYLQKNSKHETQKVRDCRTLTLKIRQLEMDRRDKTLKALQNLEGNTEVQATMMQRQIEERSQGYERQRHKRILEIGLRQQKAQEWLKSHAQNDVNNLLNDLEENYPILPVEKKRVIEAPFRESRQENSVHEDQREEERVKNEKDHTKYLLHKKSLERQKNKEMEEYKNFWQKQNEESKKKILKLKELEMRMLQKVKSQEHYEETKVKEFYDTIHKDHRSRGHNLNPLNKVDYGIFISASDGSAAKIKRDQTCPDYNMTLSRERLNLNWNDDCL